MGFRQRVQSFGGKVRNKGAEFNQKILRREDVVTTAYTGVGKAAKKTSQGATKGAEWLIQKGSERLGSDRYRDELDAALQEALRVIVVQEERIENLERQLSAKNPND